MSQLCIMLALLPHSISFISYNNLLTSNKKTNNKF